MSYYTTPEVTGVGTIGGMGKVRLIAWCTACQRWVKVSAVAHKLWKHKDKGGDAGTAGEWCPGCQRIAADIASAISRDVDIPT